MPMLNVVKSMVEHQRLRFRTHQASGVTFEARVQTMIDAMVRGIH